ncbi:Cyanobacterial TRADD-N associated 2 transmembrane domain-containing protein [Nostoc sp. DSM 114161]|uniref:TRADD-N-associated membrane domain-containing protein n=1 Tax=Nostoc sp. DSM 114161 TaxID=3440143 RepID=UPI004045F9B4
MNKLTVSHQSEPNFNQQVLMERLRQARHSFNLTLFATAMSFFVSLVGAGLLLSGKATEGTVTATGGIAASVRCAQLAKEANDRLDKTLAEINDAH